MSKSKINKKYICYLCLFFIIIIIISIIRSFITYEYFEDKSLDARVTILEKKIDGIDNNLQKTNETINGINNNLQKVTAEKTINTRIDILDNNANLFNNMIDKFKQNNNDKYKKMYLWYAKLTGADPEEVKKDEAEAVKRNEDKIKDLEAEMEQKYNKK
jgi:prefoldin subunit 5